MTMTAAPGWLREELVSLAWCWRLARRDGVVIGLTSHDRDLMVGGVVFRAAPGMKPSAIETRDEIDAATMDIEGAIASAAIAARDLDTGRWDGAELTLSVTDWTVPDAAPVTVARGVLGAIERRGGAFAAELQGVTRALDRPVCPATSPSCRAMLGDRACRVDLAPRGRWRRCTAGSPPTAPAGLMSAGSGAAASTPAGATMSTCRWARAAKPGASHRCRPSPGSVRGTAPPRRCTSTRRRWPKLPRRRRSKSARSAILRHRRRFYCS
ncbi:DUF2163 domain-containing protein [Sphingopyxis sp.]|uniref:DUF2163 domain-containing protein n=1 Tax=Sphingopyxis sp. TaxID=1908224 RepID=UPI003D80F60C